MCIYVHIHAQVRSHAHTHRQKKHTHKHMQILQKVRSTTEFWMLEETGQVAAPHVAQRTLSTKIEFSQKTCLRPSAPDGECVVQSDALELCCASIARSVTGPRRLHCYLSGSSVSSRVCCKYMGVRSIAVSTLLHGHAWALRSLVLFQPPLHGGVEGRVSGIVVFRRFC